MNSAQGEAAGARRAEGSVVSVQTWSDERNDFHMVPMRVSPFLPVVDDFPEGWREAEPPTWKSARVLGDSAVALAHSLAFDMSERWCPTGLPDHSLFSGEAWFHRHHPYQRGAPFVSERAVAVLYQERPGEDVVAEQSDLLRRALPAHLEDPGFRVRQLALHGTGEHPSLGYSRTCSSRFLDPQASQWQSSRERCFESYTRVGGLVLVVSVTSYESNNPTLAMSNKDMNCLMECLTAITVARLEGRC